MESWALLFAFLLVLAGAFVLKKLWLGGLLGIAVFLATKFFLNTLSAGLGFTFINGGIIALELGLLLFGAYLFYNLLSEHCHFNDFKAAIALLPSRLSVVLILCWFFGSFMEGIAGFGIPAMLVAPLMLTAGFRPLTSIVLPLAANTTAVTFGALGTPLKIGLNITEVDSTVLNTVLLNCLPGLMLPFLLAILYAKTEEIKLDWKKEWKMLLGAGFCFTVPYAFAGLISIEYPAVLAGGLGIVLFVVIFIPAKQKPKTRFWGQLFWPYLLFVGLLIGIKQIAAPYSWQLSGQLKNIAAYQPGLVFILAAMVVLALINYRHFSAQLAQLSKATLLRVGKPLLTILLLVCFSQLIKPDLTTLIQEAFLGGGHQLSLIFAPLAGVMGSFITGSATMSNLLLHQGIRSAATDGSLLPLALALLNTGSAIGNAISFQNIVMVKSVVNASVSYGQVVRKNMLVIGVYLAGVALATITILLFRLT